MTTPGEQGESPTLQHTEERRGVKGIERPSHGGARIATQGNLPETNKQELNASGTEQSDSSDHMFFLKFYS